MKINNNFNVLPFYDSLQKQNSKKWYSFGQHYPLICPNNTILPFQFITDSEVTVSSNIEAVNVHSGKVTNLGVKPSVSKGTQADATYYIVKMVETTISAMPEGLHYLRINTNKGYLYSEEFTFNANHEECIKIEYWNENTLNFNSGEINFDDDFRFILYIPSTIGKPEYEFEEELTKRLGYKFIESQTSNKIYKFNFLAPEYICDAMRLIRLCDYIKLTTKFDTFNALSFAYEPKWQDNGDLAAVDVEFDTDCIIQKLESFNRRLKESFYNALLADIDEPVLFSNDIVAQYYTEFTTTSYINGKLIRQLEAINEADLSSLENLVLPIDNQSDTEQKAKKITLASLKNVLIKLADYVTLSSAQNINGEKNFIGGLKVNGSPIIYDSVNKCWKLQGNLVLTGGITMYADDGTLNLPSIYDGLPIDGTTIYWDTDAAGNRVLKAVGGGGTSDSVAWNNITGKPSWIGSSKPTYSYSEIQNTPDLSKYATESWVTQRGYALQTALDATNTEVAKKWTQDNSKIANWDSAFGWGNHANAGYAKKTYVDETFVNLTGEQTISGKKNFTTGGLFVNGRQIKYDSTKNYWKLEGDLLVTGGITMYGNEGSYTPSTIMDAIEVDGVTISKSGGVLKVIGGTGGGSVEGLASVAYSGKYDDLIGKPTLLSSFTDDVVNGKYLPLSGGTLTNTSSVPLTINANNDGQVALFLQSKGNNKTYVGWDTSRGTCLYEFSSDSHIGILNGVPKFNSNTLWHSGNFTPSNYLPLSGGTINGTSANPLTINRTNNENTTIELRLASNSNTKAYLGWNTTDGVFLQEGESFAYLGILTNKTPYFYDGTRNTLWHSGNDGSGSGLNADLLDGKHLNDILASNVASATYAPNTSKLYSTDNIYSYGSSNPYYGYLTYNQTHNEWDFKVTPNTPEFIHVNSCDKLRNSRTIWGQSFDGTGNVSGQLTNVSIIRFGQEQGVFQGDFYSKSLTSYDIVINGQKLILNPSDNVGIGTVSPSYKLDVNGSLGVSGNIHIGANSIFGKNDSNALSCSSNHVVIGYGTAENGWPTYIDGNVIYFRYGTSHTNGMYLNSLGDIGVGTTSPSYKLDVNGTICANGHIVFKVASDAKIGQQYSAGDTSLYNYIKFNSGANGIQYYSGLWTGGNHAAHQFYTKSVEVPTMVIMNDGNVGIGTTSPGTKLHVSGDVLGNSICVNNTDGSGNGISLYKGTHSINFVTTYGIWFGLTSTFGTHGNVNGDWATYFSMSNDSGRGWVFRRSDNVRVASISKDGDVLVNGGLTMYSDQRKKTILNHVELSLKQIANAPIIEHYYNSDENRTTHVGSIAQYWASMNDWFCKKDSEGYFTMEIQNAALASAISIARELVRYETKTDKAIKRLKKRISELEDEVERLKCA